MQKLDGLSFGNVWSYGNINEFQKDFEKTAVELSGQQPVEQPKAEQTKNKAPEDVGLTRYLSSSGDAKLKEASLAHTMARVQQFKYAHDGMLPEQEQLTEKEHIDVRDHFFPGTYDVHNSVSTLAGMLEKKALEKLRSKPGMENAELTPEGRAQIREYCAKAFDKAITAAALRMTPEELADGTVPPEVQAGQRNAILNAALGMAELMLTGQIDEDSAVTLMNDGKLLDLSNELDTAYLLKMTADKVKEKFVQEGAIQEELERLEEQFENHEIDEAQYTDRSSALIKLREARQRFALVLDFEIKDHDPSGKLDDKAFVKKQLEDAKLRLQQFRYDLERCTGDVGKEFGHGKFSFYGVMEKIRRSCSNWLGNRHLKDRFPSNKERMAAFRELVATENHVAKGYGNILKIGGKAPGGATALFSRIRESCTLTHQANNGARYAEADGARRRAWNEVGNTALSFLRESGGMKSVETNVSVSALVELGGKHLLSGQASVGGFKKVMAKVTAQPGSVYTLTLSSEVGGKAGVKLSAAKDKASLGVDAQVSGGKEVIRTFKNERELIDFCRRHAPSLLEKIPDAVVENAEEEAETESTKTESTKTDDVVIVQNHADQVNELKDKVGEKIGQAKEKLGEVKNKVETAVTTAANKAKELKEKLEAIKKKFDTAVNVIKNENVHKVAKFLGSVAGLRIHKTKNFNEVAFDNRLHGDGILQDLDTLLTERKNPLATEVTTYKTLSGGVDAHAEIKGSDGSKKGGGSLGLGGKLRYDGVTKSLMNARTAFAMYNRFELLPLINVKCQQYDNYFKTAFNGIEDDFTKHLAELMNSLPQLPVEEKEFVSVMRGISDKMQTLIRENENFLLSANKDMEAEATVIFAKRTALLAMVNEYFVKFNQEVNVPRSLGDEFAVNISHALERPRIALDPSIVEKHVQFGMEFRRSEVTESVVRFDATWDLEKDFEEAKNNSGLNTNTEFLSTALKTFQESATSGADEVPEENQTSVDKMGFEKGLVGGQLTIQNHHGSSDMLQPWRETDSLQFDLEVTRPLNPISLLTVASKMCSKMIERDPKNSALRTSLGNAMKQLAEELGKISAGGSGKGGSGLTTTSETSNIDLSGIPVLGQVITSLGLTLDKTDETVRKEGVLLSLRFENGSFSTCTVSDFVSNATTVEFGLKAAKLPFALNVNKTSVSREERTQLSFIAGTSPDDLLRPCLGLLVANGPENGKNLMEVENFLNQNEAAVTNLAGQLHKLIREGKACPDTIGKLDTYLRNVLDPSLATKVPLQMRQAAGQIQAELFGFGGILSMLGDPAVVNDDSARFALMNRLIVSLAYGYSVCIQAQEAVQMLSGGDTL